MINTVTTASSLGQEVEDKAILENYVSFYLMPVWLRDALQGMRVSKEILFDAENRTRILTEEDINFYNKQVGDFNSIRSLINLPDDIYFHHLFRPSSVPSAGICSSILDQEAERVKSREAILPFIYEEGLSEAKDNLVFQVYPIFDFSNNLDKVFVHFGVASPGEAPNKAMEQYEALAKFLISEYGIKQVATSKVFKKILETQSCL